MQYDEARLISTIADALKRGDLAEASPWTTARRIDDAISGAPTRITTCGRHCPACGPAVGLLGAFEKGTGPNPNSRPMPALVNAIRARETEARTIAATPPLLTLR